MQPWPESGLFTDDSLSLSLPSMPASLLTPFLCRPRLSRLPWSYIVVDEGHRLKNAGCKLNAELRGYSAQHRLLLTGVCGGWQMGSRVGWYNCLQVPLPLYISTASRTPLQALRCRTDWTSCGACSTSSCPRSSTLATTSSSGKSVQQEGPFWLFLHWDPGAVIVVPNVATRIAGSGELSSEGEAPALPAPMPLAAWTVTTRMPPLRLPRRKLLPCYPRRRR